MDLTQNGTTPQNVVFLQTCFFHVQFGKRVGSASKMFLEHLGLRVLGYVKKSSILENVGVL